VWPQHRLIPTQIRDWKPEVLFLHK
jgi:hypothetical protein